VCEGDPSRRAECGQKQALRQQLSHDVAAAGSERSAYRHFAPSRVGAREQQVHDVGTGNQQHQAHGTHQDEERPLDGAGDKRRKGHG
jgi:hypothetical protein